MKKLVRPAIGSEIEINGIKWKVLDQTENGYICLAEKVRNMKFGNTNDWKVSDIRAYLNGPFYDELSAVIGGENIVPFERNLLSLDGQTEYGTCEDKVSLISLDEYRKYRALIENAVYWWWTITPDSTPCNNDNYWIRVVSPGGCVYDVSCNYYYGVRPFCIFSSELFESEDE